MAWQASLFPDAPPAAGGLPPGFRYQADLLTAAEEAGLADRIAQLDLKPFEFRGYQGRRRVHAFGYRYDYARGELGDAQPIPPFLLAVRDKVAGFAGRSPEAFVHVLATEYAPGAPIGWHRDKPQFGEVVGVSLLSPCTLRLRRRREAGWERAAALLQPRSAYLLAGEARQAWEHSIPPAEALRYSLTFRTLAQDGAGRGER